MKNAKKRYLISLLAILLVLVATAFCACDKDGNPKEIWGDDKTTDNPDYVVIDDEPLYFTLELRQPGSTTEVSDGDTFPHSSIDGELIYSWQIPYYGNTVYESVLEFFDDREDSITFRVSQHRYQMFHDCTLVDGTTYNLERVYIAADGEYAMCANFQTLYGKDEIAGTVDDLKVLVLVLDGWINY